jgi:hypothetical protein
MAKRKAAEAADALQPDNQDVTGQAAESRAAIASPQDPPAQPHESASPGDEAADAPRSPWQSRFGSWSDDDAGVRLIEDRQNRRMTIKFVEKPPEAVRSAMKDPEYGYRFDGEELVWYKKINAAKPIQARQEAEELAFKVANMIREEKGMEQKKSFAIAL